MNQRLFSDQDTIVKLTLTGKQGVELVDRLSTLDLKSITPSSPSETALFLSDRGKIKAAFQIKKLNEETLDIFLALNPDERWLEAFQSTLEQFTFSERYELSKPKPALGQEVLVHQSIEKRIGDLSPTINHEVTLDSNPLEVGLFNAIHQTKGCYPGQEVIEKTLSIGSPAKILCLLQLDFDSNATNTLPPLPWDLYPADDDATARSCGQLTSFSKSSKQGLSILKKTFAEKDKKVRSDHDIQGIVARVDPKLSQNSKKRS